MDNLSIKELVWSDKLQTKSAFHLYTVREDSEVEGKYVVLYCRRYEGAKMKKATGFPSIEVAKSWAREHYLKKMQPYTNELLL